jgi:hypothetical protein
MELLLPAPLIFLDSSHTLIRWRHPFHINLFSQQRITFSYVRGALRWKQCNMADKNDTIEPSSPAITNPPGSDVAFSHDEAWGSTLFSDSTSLHVLPNPKNPFDHPDGKQVSFSPYEPTTEKEVVHAPHEIDTKENAESPPNELGTNPKRRVYCGCLSLPLLLFLIIAATITVLGVALGAGLGIGLKKYMSRTKSLPESLLSNKHSSHSLFPITSPSASPTTSSTPSYISKTGAYNGTALALGSTPVEDPNGQVELYFQHHTGEIRWFQRSNKTTDKDWTGGDIAVVKDARNATPLSIVTNTYGDASVAVD